jgi:small GTP-binding protein
MDCSQSDVEKSILKVFEKYTRAKGLLTAAFPKSEYLNAILKGLMKDLTDKSIDEITVALRREFLHYLQKWIGKEFDDSAGKLALSIKELQDYFLLDKILTNKIIDNHLKTERYVLQEDLDLSTGEEIKRLQIHPKYSRNYWLKSVIVQREAEVLIKLGFLLEKPLNRNLVIKKRHVVELNLSQQSLSVLPKKIANLTNLKKLNLQHNELTALPDTIGNLTNLKVLDLDYNKLTSLPESVGNLKNLQILCCRHNKLTSLPVTLGSLKCLQRLSLGGNKLRSLPESLGNLTNLQKLWCPYNKLSFLPETLGNLKNLEKLSLEHNQLRPLPDSLGDLSKLKILRLKGNKLPSLPKGIIQTCDVCGSKLKDPKSKRHIRTIKHQKALKRRESRRDENEHLLKICTIGSGNVGKTSLIRRFAEGKFETDYLPTLGVDITTKKIKVDNNQIKLILVDTAGQEFFGKLRPSYYRGASACSVFFDKSDLKSFKSVPDWLAEFRKHIPDVSIPIALVGIITNSEHVTTEDGQKLAKRLDMSYYEVQTTISEQISQIFYGLTRQVLSMKSP